MFRKFYISNRLPNRYPSENCRWVPLQFDMSPVFSNVVHMLGVIPATLCSAERSFSVLHRLKTYLRSTMGNNVSVTSHLLTLKGHMPTLQSTMVWIVSLLFSAVKMRKTAIFNVFYELLIICLRLSRSEQSVRPTFGANLKRKLNHRKVEGYVIYHFNNNS